MKKTLKKLQSLDDSMFRKIPQEQLSAVLGGYAGPTAAGGTMVGTITVNPKTGKRKVEVDGRGDN